MPISPAAQKRYPPDWPQVRLAICERARWRCEHPGCGAAQYSIGRWIAGEGDQASWRPVVGNTPVADAVDRAMHAAGEGRLPSGDPWTFSQARDFLKRWAWDDPQPIIIVLTVAHLNHKPEDCRPENLRAWCQRHHLAYDLEHHQQNAQATRRARKAIGELF